MIAVCERERERESVSEREFERAFKLPKDNITYAERSKIKHNLIRDNIGRKKKR